MGQSALDKIALNVKRLHSYFGFLEEFTFKRGEINQLYKMRLKYMVKIKHPLVLISQIQRSGGSMLSQLFDAHPQCYAHPHELMIGKPSKYNWPDLKLTHSYPRYHSFLYWKLFEPYTLLHFRKGYTKASNKKESLRHNFLMLPRLQREIFMQFLKEEGVTSQRDILNAYMTSYFNAWVDYQDLYRENKKYVVAFTPRIHMYEDSIARYFRDYPDGKLISVIREPKSWYASAKIHGYPEPAKSIPIWNASAEAMIKNKKKYGDKVLLLNFKDLIKDTQNCMRSVAVFLGIDYHPTLTDPTFQGMLAEPNSSFDLTQLGVSDAPLKRSKELLPEDKAYIEKHSVDIYEKVAQFIEKIKGDAQLI